MVAKSSKALKRKQREGSDIQQRRERGRAAQAAFRKRQIDRIKEQDVQLNSYSEAMKLVKLAYNECRAALKISATLGDGHLPSRIGNHVVEQLEAALQLVSTAETAKADRPKDAEHEGKDSKSACRPIQDLVDTCTFFDAMKGNTDSQEPESNSDIQESPEASVAVTVPGFFSL